MDKPKRVFSQKFSWKTVELINTAIMGMIIFLLFKGVFIVMAVLLLLLLLLLLPRVANTEIKDIWDRSLINRIMQLRITSPYITGAVQHYHVVQWKILIYSWMLLWGSLPRYIWTMHLYHIYSLAQWTQSVSVHLSECNNIWCIITHVVCTR